jgi:hypothetical protein
MQLGMLFRNWFDTIVKKEGAGDVGLQLFMTTYHYIRREPSISPERFSDYAAMVLLRKFK